MDETKLKNMLSERISKLGNFLDVTELLEKYKYIPEEKDNITGGEIDLEGHIKDKLIGCGLFTNDPEDVLKVKPESSYTKDVKNVVKIISVNPKNAKLFGSFIYKSQLYPADIDIIENVIECCEPEETIVKAAKKIKAVVKRIDETRGYYIGDIKAGIDYRYKINIEPNYKSLCKNYKDVLARINELYKLKLISKREYDKLSSLVRSDTTQRDYDDLYDMIREKWLLRWTKEEILTGYKMLPLDRKIYLEETLLQPSMVKVDAWVPLNGNYTEVTNVFAIFNMDKDGKINLLTFTNNVETLFEDLKVEVRKYGFHEKYFKPFKMCKRLWSMARLIKDNEMIDKLTPLLQSDCGRITQVNSEIETIVSILENIKVPPIASLLKQIDRLKGKLSNVYEIKIGEAEIDKALDSISKSEDNIQRKIKVLSNIKDHLKDLVDRNTMDYLEKVRLLPIPKKYIS